MPQGWGQPRRSSSRAFLWGQAGRQQSMHQVPNGGPTKMAQQVSEEKSYRDKVIVEYEEELKEARLWAHIIGFLHKFSQFLAFCNLTWASVALLGAFLPSLLSLDFTLVTFLLFIEAGRLASASFFLHFLMRPLAYGSQDPKRIDHGGDEQYPASRNVRRFSNFVQCLLIAPGFVIPIIGHALLHDYSTLNLNASLRIFYSFVALNSLVASVNLICYARAFKALSQSPEQSILRYFDTVLERAMSSGLVQADVFEFFGFAYTMLGADYQRGVQPKAVAGNHKRLIKYLNAHRLGPDALKISLEVEDPFVQLAAVNMVGFWSDKSWNVGVPEEERKLSEELLTKLADKVGTGQIGWAAATSFGALAGTPKGAQMVVRTRTSSNRQLRDELVNLVDDSSNRSLSLVRTLVQMYEQYCKLEEAQQPPIRLFAEEEKLVGKLEKLASGAKFVHRLRVTAAYLLLLMGKPCDAQVVLAIDPNKDTYWFTSEISMLKLLRSFIPDPPRLPIPLHSKPDPQKPHLPPKPFVREGADITTPPYIKLDPSTLGPLAHNVVQNEHDVVQIDSDDNVQSSTLGP